MSAPNRPGHVTQENWDLASRDASLGVDHVWHNMRCPAYRSFDPNDCTCTKGTT